MVMHNHNHRLGNTDIRSQLHNKEEQEPYKHTNNKQHIILANKPSRRRYKYKQRC